EWHGECWHGGTFGIGEYVVEHAASNVMRVHKRVSDAGNDRAATILASEAGAPDVCRLGRNDRGDAGFVAAGFFPSSRSLDSRSIRSQNVSQNFCSSGAAATALPSLVG